MSENSSLDRESFQQLLASAFAVQESRMDTQSLSAIIQIQRLIARGELDADAAIRAIAEHAQNVAHASGVAVALLQGHQLIYRAGVGSAASYVGRHMTATLSVTADTLANREILRVENAQNDARIEASICRQFGAESLLIMPVYQSQAITGVLAVMFREAHSFQDREVRAYRMMGGLVGEVQTRAAQLEETKAVPDVLSTVDQTIPHVEALADDQSSFAEPENKNAIYQICQATMAAAGDLPAFWRLSERVTTVREGMKRLAARISGWRNVAMRPPQLTAVAAAVVALVIVGWTAYVDRHSASTASSAMQVSNAPDGAVSVPAKPSALASGSELQTVSGAEQSTKVFKPAVRRVRVGANEVDYVSEDVTVRHFTRRPPSEPLRAYNQVEFGNDVTVRYFASNSTAVRPVASVAQPVNNRTLPLPAKSVSPKLAQ